MTEDPRLLQLPAELRLLVEVAQQSEGAQSIPELIAGIQRSLVAQDYGQWLIVMHQDEQYMHLYHASEGAPAELVHILKQGIMYPYGVAWTVWASGKSFFSDRYGASQQALPQISAFFEGQVAFIPLKKWGVLVLGQDDTLPWTSEQTITIETAGSLVAVAMERLSLISKERDQWHFNQALLGSLTEYIVACDAYQQVVYINDPALAMLKHLGIGAESLMGHSIQELTIFFEQYRGDTSFPEHHPFILACAGKATHNVETHLQIGKHTLDLLCNFTPIRTESGTQGGAVCTATDLSSLKRAIQAQAHSEAHFKAAFSGSFDAMLVLEIELESIYVRDMNAQAEHMFQLVRSEARGCPLQDILPKLCTPKQYRRLFEIWKEQQAFDEIVTLPMVAGTPNFPSVLHIQAIPTPSGLVLNLRDITEERQIQARLAESEQHFRLLTENAGDIIARHDTEARCLYVSPACYPILGYTVEEMLGETQWSRFHPEDIPVMLEGFRPLSEGRDVTMVRYRMLHKAGYFVWLEVTAKAIRDVNGALIETHTVSRDITDRVGIEQALLERTQEIQLKNAALERANRIKTEFLATMSHELRTPLTSILGFSELLAGQFAGPLSEQQTMYAQNIYKSGQQLLRLIDDLLDLSKIEAGRLILEPVDMQLGEVVRACLTMVQERAMHKHQQIHVDVPKNLWLHADIRKIKQILVNLLTNAVKFTDEGGQIWISAERLPSREAVIRVRDTGVGISEEQKERLFEPFSQLDSSLSRRYEGTGLGLTLCKRLIELHQGRLEVESVKGVGSTFIVILPL